MTDHTKLVKALRHCNGASFLTCHGCQYSNDLLTCTYKMLRDAADAIEELQATIELMKPFMPDFFPDANNVVLPKLEPKRGEWVEDTTTYAGPGLSNYKCSLCGKICGTWRRGLEPSELPNWCGNCGADMRKM